jgi:hypothetical protein
MVLVYQYIGSPEAFVKERYWLTKRSVTGPGFPAPMTRKVKGPGGAAELLGVKPPTLLSRMNKMGLKRPGR